MVSKKVRNELVKVTTARVMEMSVDQVPLLERGHGLDHSVGPLQFVFGVVGLFVHEPTVTSRSPPRWGGAVGRGGVCVGG